MKKQFFYVWIFILLVVILEFSCDFLIRQHYLLLKIFGNSDIFWETYFLNNHKSGTLDNSTCFTYDPRLGWKSKNSCVDLRNGITYCTDSMGMRRIPYGSCSIAKNKILFMGDSFTEGAEVADSFSFPALLQKIRPDIKVYNSGIGGYSHSQMLLLLKDRIQQLHPTQVILGFVNDDVSRNQLLFNGFAKPAYSLKEGELVLKNGQVKPPDVILNEHPFRSSVFLLLRFLLSEKHSYSSDTDLEVTRHLMNQMKVICTQNNIPFKVLLIPTPSELQQTPGKKIFVPWVSYLEQDNVPFYSLESVLKKSIRGSEDGKPHGHWGEKANAFIAIELATHVLRE